MAGIPRGVLTVTAGAVFLAFLDVTVVNVAFPDLARSYPQATRAELSWVFSAYSIAFAALLVPAGRLGDVVGHRRVFLIGVALFSAASAACALAPSAGVLVAARAAQGAGGALAIPSAQALLMDAVADERRGAALGLWSAAAAAAAALGPTLGGVLVDAFGWRSVFLVNVPLGAATLLIGRRVLAERRAEAMPLDLRGSALAAVAMATLALGLVQGPSWGWASAPVLTCFAAAAVAGGLLLRHCARRAAPIVDLALFRIPAFAPGSTGTLCFGVAFFASLLCQSLFLAGVWGFDPLDVGLAMAPGPLVGVVAAVAAGRLVDAGQARRAALAGAAGFVLAGAWFAARLGPDPDVLGVWLPGVLLLGAGIGLGYTTLTTVTVSHLGPARFGDGSAVSAMTRQFGAVLGVSLLVAVLGSPGADPAAAFVPGWILVALAALAGGLAAVALPGRLPGPADGDRAHPAHRSPGGRSIHTDHQGTVRQRLT